MEAKDDHFDPAFQKGHGKATTRHWPKLLHLLEIQTRAVVHGVRDFKLEFQAGMKASKISLAGSAALAANVPFTGLALLILAK